jgi:small subunit ribosomal protein S11
MQQKKKKYQKLQQAKLIILSGTRNTIFTLTTMEGNKLFGCSPACYGFKNTKKGSPVAVKTAFGHMKHAILELFGIKQLHVILHGPGASGADILNQQIHHLPVKSIANTSNLAHGGCRVRRPRRV